MAAAAGEPTSVVRERVLAARAVQYARGWLNAQPPATLLREHCALDTQGRQLVADAVDRGGMSARRPPRAARRANDRGPRGRGARERATAGGGAAVPGVRGAASAGRVSPGGLAAGELRVSRPLELRLRATR